MITKNFPFVSTVKRSMLILSSAKNNSVKNGRKSISKSWEFKPPWKPKRTKNKMTNLWGRLCPENRKSTIAPLLHQPIKLKSPNKVKKSLKRKNKVAWITLSTNQSTQKGRWAGQRIESRYEKYFLLIIKAQSFYCTKTRKVSLSL